MVRGGIAVEDCKLKTGDCTLRICNLRFSVFNLKSSASGKPPGPGPKRQSTADTASHNTTVWRSINRSGPAPGAGRTRRPRQAMQVLCDRGFSHGAWSGRQQGLHGHGRLLDAGHSPALRPDCDAAWPPQPPSGSWWAASQFNPRRAGSVSSKAQIAIGQQDPGRAVNRVFLLRVMLVAEPQRDPGAVGALLGGQVVAALRRIARPWRPVPLRRP